jgi:AcrR family transcriptional regulator
MATRKRSTAGGVVVRSGRPPRELAGEVEERILDAAAEVFLERGFEGASVDEIADVARAGKPTIYARFPGKEALFTAVVERNVREITSSFERIAPTGSRESLPDSIILDAVVERLTPAGDPKAEGNRICSGLLHEFAQVPGCTALT